MLRIRHFFRGYICDNMAAIKLKKDSQYETL